MRVQRMDIQNREKLSHVNDIPRINTTTSGHYFTLVFLRRSSHSLW